MNYSVPIFTSPTCDHFPERLPHLPKNMHLAYSRYLSEYPSDPSLEHILDSYVVFHMRIEDEIDRIRVQRGRRRNRRT